MIKTGKYRHYKGNEYEVLGTAKHSETLKEFVVYRALYGDRDLWIRPLEMFIEEVDVGGGAKKPRFNYIGN
jgi:hypothetical protein